MKADPSRDSWLEVVRERADRGRLRAALLDFDGTLSLVRQGWQDVMIPMMVEVLRQADDQELRDLGLGMQVGAALHHVRLGEAPHSGDAGGLSKPRGKG